MNNKKKISIIVPVYNEEKNIPLLYATVLKTIAQITEYEYEFIFINDGSKDNSWTIIKNLPISVASIKALNFSKNFGHQIALSAGYNHATGDAIISMDADLQHPPETIPSMIKAWQKGFDIVYVKNVTRNDSFLKKICALGYYRFLGLLSEIKIPRNVADFRLIDKKVLAIINQSEEKAPYLRGMVAWTGFKHTFIESTFAKRHSGIPGYTWSKMFKLALDGIVSFSSSPFQLLGLISLFITISGSSLLVYLIVNSLIFYKNYSALTWILTILYFSMGIQLIVISSIGEKIVMMYNQTKNRPLYIIADKINC